MAAQDQRPRFYESQYLGADDMNAVVEYAQTQIGRHELGAHMAGIAVGLYLVESPTAGAPQRRNVSLVPGMAIDGFGRQVVVLKRDLLPEALFAGIAYDANVDDPAANGGTPPGRFVRVWVEYQETNATSPPPGFAQCDAGDQFARVQEGYRFVIGDRVIPAERRSPVSIGGQSVAPERALQAFDMTAGLLYDGSVPQQQLPANSTSARWLVPVGYVRWVAYAQGGGYFVDRNIDSNDPGDDRIRRSRQYIGVPAECIDAVDGALVLRGRSAKPDDPGRFQARLQSSDAVADTLRDLVWVEGNMRVVGDARFAAGAVRFADINGSDRQTPLSFERRGDGAAPGGGRSLAAMIGPDAQPTNRFAVATVTVDDPNPALRQIGEKLSVLSGGNVGIGNDAPARKLHVKGDRIRLDSPDGAKTIEMRTDGSQVDLQSTANDLFLRSGAGAPPHNIVMNPDAADGNVGIGTAAPAYKLDVKATAIKLGLEAAGGGQLVIKNNPGDNKIFLEAFDTAGTGHAAEMLLTGKDGYNAPLVSVLANTTHVSDNLGVGTGAPDSRLHVMGNTHVVGDSILLEDPTGTKNIKLFTSGTQVDLYTSSNDLSLRSAGHNCLINWLGPDGNVGIGTGAPTEKLHVGGGFLQVDGAGGEQAVVGGEGNGAVVLGSRDWWVQYADMRNMNFPSGYLYLRCLDVVYMSDARAKTNVRDISGALDKVAALRGVSFEWKDAEDSEGRSRPVQGGPRLGLIAQEVQQVVPEAVTLDARGAGLSLSAIVPLLIEAVKELKQQNADMKAEIARLRSQLAGAGQPKGRKR